MMAGALARGYRRGADGHFFADDAGAAEACGDEHRLYRHRRAMVISAESYGGATNRRHEAGGHMAIALLLEVKARYADMAHRGLHVVMRHSMAVDTSRITPRRLMLARRHRREKSRRRLMRRASRRSSARRYSATMLEAGDETGAFRRMGIRRLFCQGALFLECCCKSPARPPPVCRVISMPPPSVP